MAFKPLNTQIIDIKKQQDKPYIGTFVRGEKTEGAYGENWTWHFLDEDEVPFAIYGFTMLNRAMNMVKPGMHLRITYKGTEKVQTKKFGKKDVHQVLVEVDDESREPVGAAKNGSKSFSDGLPVPDDNEIPF